MVKLMTDKEVDEKCKLFRPIPLYLQQAVLAVPNKQVTKSLCSWPDKFESHESKCHASHFRFHTAEGTVI